VRIKEEEELSRIKSRKFVQLGEEDVGNCYG
jgi:hypothetical protein